MRLQQPYRCFLAHNASSFVTDVDVTLISNSRVCASTTIDRPRFRLFNRKAIFGIVDEVDNQQDISTLCG